MRARRPVTALVAMIPLALLASACGTETTSATSDAGSPVATAPPATTAPGGEVTAAATDAEQAAQTPPDCPEVVDPPEGAREVLGEVDLDGDGRHEVLVAAEDGAIGIWSRYEDCSLAEVTLDGAPARFPIGLSDHAAFGVQCREQYVNDLYALTFESADGLFYGGRIAAYDLVDGVLVAAGGEGAEYDRTGLEPLARLDCGSVHHP
jgi:hypothetical protein